MGEFSVPTCTLRKRTSEYFLLDAAVRVTTAVVNYKVLDYQQ